MIRALTAEQTRAAEQRAVAERGVTLDALMRRAGEALAEAAARLAGKATWSYSPAEATTAATAGWRRACFTPRVATVRVLSAGRSRLAGGSREGRRRRGDRGGSALARASAPRLRLKTSRPQASSSTRCWASAQAGRCANRCPTWIDAAAESGCPIASADIPSGVDADTGAIGGTAIPADVTVTFSALKRGLVTYPGADYAGDVVVADVGIPPALLEFDDAPEVWEEADYAQLLPLPAPDTHKDERGRVLVVAGSAAYPGAAILAAKGAQRSGAGYVTLACPENMVPVAHQHLIAATVMGMPASHRAFSSRSARAHPRASLTSTTQSCSAPG